MIDEQNAAEQLDEDVLGDDPSTDELPGLNQFVEIGPMSSEDPTVLLAGADARDDSRTRDWREEPETDPDEPQTSKRSVTDLLEPDEAGPDQIDDEEELIAEASRPADGVVGPEAAALHIESGR